MSSLNSSRQIFSHLRHKLYFSVQEGRWSRSLFLRPLSGLWSFVAHVKNWLYDRRVLPIHHSPIQVVSIGNIVAGGSGKTPLVHLLAQALHTSGPIAILSRGYRSKKSALLLGDELTMLSHRLPQAICIANPDRASGAQKAVLQGARLIILDDGFQHRRLHRDLDLVVIDSSNPFGYGAFLPRGLLRDPPSRLKSTDAIFVNGDLSDQLESDLRKWSNAPLIQVALGLKRILDLEGREQKMLWGRKVGAFCAIGQPLRFFRTLHDCGAQIVDQWTLPDHEKFEWPQIHAFAERCRAAGATALVCTEKDAVKIPFDCSILPIYYLEMQLTIVSGQANWQNLIETIQLTSRSS
jgi:tetraacyldisaccharide 4'-kinase